MMQVCSLCSQGSTSDDEVVVCPVGLPCRVWSNAQCSWMSLSCCCDWVRASGAVFCCLRAVLLYRYLVPLPQ
eukprot:90414-Pyramimonas_sp.AAC.1